MRINRLREIIFGVVSVVFLSKLLGFIREIIIAEKFGTSSEYDLYLIAIILPALFYGVFNYASVYFLVPYFSKKITEIEQNKNVWSSVWTVINFKIFSAAIITILIILSAPAIMRIWGGGLTDIEFERLILFSQVTAVSIVLGTIEAILRSYLNVNKIFIFPASGFLIFNIFSIGCIVLFAENLSVGAIAIGWLAGLFFQNVYLLLRVLKLDLFRNIKFSLDTKEIRLVTSGLSVIILIEFINRSYFLIDRYFAVSFGEGSVAALNYSNVLIILPDAVIGFAIASVLFPLFSKQSIEDEVGFGQTYIKSIIAAITLAIPLAIMMYVNAEEIVKLLFFRGAFDADSVMLTASVLKPFVPTVIALFVISSSVRACYSGNWEKQVFYFAVIALVIKYLLTALLSNYFGIGGITAASSISFLLYAVLLVSFLISRLKLKSDSRNIAIIVNLLLAGVLPLGGLAYVKSYFSIDIYNNNNIYLTGYLILSFCIVVIIYLISLYCFGFRRGLVDIFFRNKKESIS